MPFLRTPGYYKRLSDFYYEIGALTASGIPIINALRHIVKTSRNKRIRKYSEILIEQVQSNHTLAEAFKSLKDISEFDCALIDSSERAGKLESCFKFLSNFYQERANLINQFISQIAYPVFLAHFAIFIFPFAEFFTTGNIAVYASKTIGVLIPIYVFVFLTIAALQTEKNENWRGLLESLFRWIPFLGKGRQNLYLSRFALALEALLNAGTPIITALEMAGNSCGSVRIKRAVIGWRDRLSNGLTTPAEEINRCAAFPEIFAAQFATGEVSGRLDETLKRLHSYYLEEGIRNLRLGFKMLGHLVFVVIALVIAFKIIMFYVNLYSQYEF